MNPNRNPEHFSRFSEKSWSQSQPQKSNHQQMQLQQLSQQQQQQLQQQQQIQQQQHQIQLQQQQIQDLQLQQQPLQKQSQQQQYQKLYQQQQPQPQQLQQLQDIQYQLQPHQKLSQQQLQQQYLQLQDLKLHQQPQQRLSQQLLQQQQQQLQQPQHKLSQEQQLQLQQQQPSDRSKNKLSDLGPIRSTMESSFSSGSWSYSYGPPLDYSFRNISSLEKVERRRIHPRQSLRKTRRSPSGRYNSNVIRLANNNLVDTTGLYQMALDVVEFPEDIAWLDLSFNDITEVSDDILQFQALKMLYLHGNKIKRIADISKLKQLPNLYSLTLHGNPIENQPHYRSSMICMFPQLRSLDFAKITEDEKDSARLHIIVNNNNVKKHSL